MISVEKAINSVRENCHATSYSVTEPVIDALGFVLCKDVISPINMPPFRQSAMDGYALNLNNTTVYSIIGEVKAGDDYHPVLKLGEAVRIFTGAPVPDSANAVVMQEKTEVEGSRLQLMSSVNKNDNIRPLGEQVLKGAIALNKGTKLFSAGIAYLTSLGITKVKVYKKPSIAIVVTGNELAEAGENLQYGQIYESNAIMLSIALKQLGYDKVSIHKVEDNYDSTFQLLNVVINQHDVVLVSGGISVGDYDFVGKALNELKVTELFYKVNQKPGKPLYFGKKKDKIIFALPGNPAAALTCFYMYVLLAIEKIIGNNNFSLHKTIATSTSDFIKKGERAQFLKAIYQEGVVEILEGQNSSMLHTFALANAMVYLSETATSINKEDEIEVILLPIN
jgi:molybdopterin molybdotransferase